MLTFQTTLPSTLLSDGVSHRKCLYNHDSDCWKMDKRDEESCTIYIDGYGLLKPHCYSYPMPVDLYYCANCKRQDTSSVADFIKSFKTHVPEKFYKMLLQHDREVSDYVGKIPKTKQTKTRHIDWLTAMEKKRKAIIQEIKDLGR
jgi:hypothetical protein